MNRTTAQIIEELTAEDSPGRRALVQLLIDHWLALPVAELVDPKEFVDIVLTALTDDNLNRFLERHAHPARQRRQQRWEESGERVEQVIPEELATRVEAILARHDGPRARWAKGAIDPADLRRLLAPALQAVLLSFVDRVATLTPNVPRMPAAKPSRFGLRKKLKQNIKDRGEQILGAGKSVLDGLGLDVRERLEQAAGEFGESASSVLRESMEARLRSDEGKEILGRMRVSLFQRLLQTPLSELAGDADRLDGTEVGAIVAAIVAHNSVRDEVRASLTVEIEAMIALEGQRTLREVLDEAGLTEVVGAASARQLDVVTHGLFASEPFSRWLAALIED